MIIFSFFSTPISIFPFFNFFFFFFRFFQAEQLTSDKKKQKCLFGILGGLLREVVCGVDEAMKINNTENNVIHKNGENQKRQKSRKSDGVSDMTATLLEFRGIATAFSDLDVEQCSASYLAAKLYQFYPIWIIGRGIFIIIGKKVMHYLKKKVSHYKKIMHIFSQIFGITVAE